MRLLRRPLFLLLIACLFGTLLSSGMHLGLLGGGAVFACLLLAACVFPLEIAHRRVAFLWVAVFSVGFSWAWYCVRVPEGDVCRYAEGKRVYLTGVVASDVRPGQRGVSFVLRAEKVKTYTGEYPATGLVALSLFRPISPKRDSVTPLYGERVCIHGRLLIPSPATNPGNTDYARHLARQGIHCNMPAPDDEVVILESSRWSPAGIASRCKSVVLAKTFSLFPPEYAHLLSGILLGNYAGLPLDMRAQFIRTGTMHLLVASGYNCGIILAIFGLLFHLLTVPRAWRNILSILLIWSYALVAGLQPSLIRAAVIITVFLMGYLLKRAQDRLNSIIFAAFLLLAINPLSLYDPSFQLSFGAVLSIILIMPLAQPVINRWFMVDHTARLNWMHRVVLCAARIVLFSMVMAIFINIGTWPITAYHFNSVSAISMIANAVTAALALLLTLLGTMALVLAMALPSIGHAAAAPVQGLMWLLMKVIGFLGTCGWSVVYVRSPSPIVILIYYILLLMGLDYVLRRFEKARDQRRRSHSMRESALELVRREVAGVLCLVRGFSFWKKALVFGVAVAILVFVLLAGFRREDRVLSVVMVDVGQGDCIFLRTPCGHTILMDGGGTAGGEDEDTDVGMRTVEPFLRSQGVNRLDLVVLSHPHNDHLQGLVCVVRDWPVNMVLEPGIPYPSLAYSQFLREIRANHIQYRQSVRGEVLDFGDGVRAQVLNPPPMKLANTGDDTNNNAIVLRFTYGKEALLLMGDAGDAAEAEILNTGAMVRSDVLKVGHHGSSTASGDAWLDAVSPSVGMISVGKNNIFGHPSPKTLQRLLEHDVRVYRTDLGGAIFVDIGKSGHRVYRCQ